MNRILISEKQFQELVIDYARLKGWEVYHTHNSRRSAPGYPDLSMVRGARHVVAELKSEHGRLTPEQERWLEAFRATPAEVYIWRPSAWPDIKRVLD